mmetsp:Transcript_33356/g.94261  ORF Transcript_33356/g.94261 Transcript_33356/m.94261 type:complete len:94 (-) Transcript_33356:31-312(-)
METPTPALTSIRPQPPRSLGRLPPSILACKAQRQRLQKQWRQRERGSGGGAWGEGRGFESPEELPCTQQNDDATRQPKRAKTPPAHCQRTAVR